MIRSCKGEILAAWIDAAIVEHWSNGQTEGQITKLKLVNRQMFGRAKLDLLRARLVDAGRPLRHRECAKAPLRC